jgi:branched-chain amino acid transport system ATP-binding protein
MLQLSSVSVSYGEVQALWDVSLDVRAGELVAIIGSNGSGKSTTLKSISGLIRPRSGSMRFEDADLLALLPHQIVALGVAHVPEGRRLFPQMTVYENLVMGSLTKEAKARRREQLALVMELFPVLSARREQPAGTLSGGEQQMTAIARGLMSCPRLLMLDEPSLGLAPKVVATVFEAIQRIRRTGMTVLLVEQNTHLALNLADRAFVLENGKLVLSGTGKELLGNPHVRQAYLGIV